MESAIRSVAPVADYLSEARALPHDEQIKGIYMRWPDITPDEYATALGIYHEREQAAQKPVKCKLPRILSHLKNKSGYMTRATFMGVSWKKVNGSWCGKASWSL